MTSIHTEREKNRLDNDLQFLDTVPPKKSVVNHDPNKLVHFPIHPHAQEKDSTRIEIPAGRADY